MPVFELTMAIFATFAMIQIAAYMVKKYPSVNEEARKRTSYKVINVVACNMLFIMWAECMKEIFAADSSLGSVGAALVWPLLMVLVELASRVQRPGVSQ